MIFIINTTNYIKTEIELIERSGIDVNIWIDKYASKYRSIVDRLKTLNINILENELYKERNNAINITINIK